MNDPVLTAIALGTLSGMRTMSGLTVLSHRLSHDARPSSAEHSPERMLASRRTARILGTCAAGELIVDKLPFVGARTDPLPLAARVAAGALCGAALAGSQRRPRLGAALVGASAAVASAFVAYHVRRRAADRTDVPGELLGVAEDVVVLTVAAAVNRSLRRLR